MAALSMCDRWGPFGAMVVVDFAFSALNILVKKCLDEGMNCLIFITVRQIIATAFLAPIAYFKERNCRPKLTWWILTQLFFSALLGAFLTQYLFFVGLKYTTPTFTCAFFNLSPVLTFLIALLMRQERVYLKSIEGKAKLVSTIVCIGGVLILMLYRGPQLGSASSHGSSKLAYDTASKVVGRDDKKATMEWSMGSIALFGGSLCWSAWFPVQAKIGRQYPAVYSSNTILFFMASLQSAMAALLTTYHQGLHLWIDNIAGTLRLPTVLYAGVVASGSSFLVMSWCIKKRGPVFTVSFTPGIQIIVAFIDFLITRQPPRLGSVLGSIFVVLGLYLLLWSKSRDADGRCEIKPVQEIAKNGDVSGKGEDV